MPTIKELDIKNQLIKVLKTVDRVESEVKCSCGLADVVTTNLLIEIKESKRYKEAIGQLASYKTDIKNKTQVLYLFSRDGKYVDSKTQSVIFNACKGNRIKLFQHNYTNPYAFIYWLKNQNLITHVPYSTKSKQENFELFKDVDKMPCKVYNKVGELIKTIQ